MFEVFEVFEVFRCKVRILHGHFNVAMSENSLQYQNVSPIHHEVCCKRMAQNVSQLAMGEGDASLLN